MQAFRTIVAPVAAFLWLRGIRSAHVANRHPDTEAPPCGDWETSQIGPWRSIEGCMGFCANDPTHRAQPKLNNAVERKRSARRLVRPIARRWHLLHHGSSWSMAGKGQQIAHEFQSPLHPPAQTHNSHARLGPLARVILARTSGNRIIRRPPSRTTEKAPNHYVDPVADKS